MFFKNTQKITELEKRIIDLENKLESISKIEVGGNSFIDYFSYARQKIRIDEVVRLLISHQGLELKRTSAIEKVELVKSEPLYKIVNITTDKKRKRQ